MLDRLESRERRTKPGEAELASRAAELSTRYLGGRAVPISVRWVNNQGARWGSCTPADRSIRLSDRLRGMPDFVIDYVLLHELAHLIEPNHGAGFWKLLESFPKLERARGYLDGFAAASHAPGESGPAARPPTAPRAEAPRTSTTAPTWTVWTAPRRRSSRQPAHTRRTNSSREPARHAE